jgi:hypothetical protein
MPQARIVVARGEVRLELEGDQAFVESNLQKLLPMVRDVEAADTRSGSGVNGKGAGSSPASKGGRQTFKTFMTEKSPNNTYEAIAIVLHYMRQHEQKDELSGAEIRTALIQGGYRPPDQMAQALTDCRRKYGYAAVGSKKGLWRLSNQGETLVEIDLPKAKAS